MTAFVPGSYSAVFWLGGWTAIAALVGFILQSRSHIGSIRLFFWLLSMSVPLSFSLFTQGEPAGFRMLIIITALFYGMKILAGLEGQHPLKLGRWLIFFFCWPGMRHKVFADIRRERTQVTATALSGLYRLLAGFFIASLASSLASQANIWLCSALMLVGISLIVHFGLFNINAALLRQFGFDTRPLFREPLKSKTLDEFWSRRWNLAYSELISLTVYRPLSTRVSKPTATMISFACSGFFHELAISLPVMRGFGLPTLYFLIQGAFVIIERKLVFIPARSKLLTTMVILLPLPILFIHGF